MVSMRFRNVKANGDWDFGRGLQCYGEGTAAIALNVKTRLMCWLGDCFFDSNMGIDYQNLMGNFGQKNAIREQSRRMILATDGVLSILSFEDMLVDRKYSANYVIDTIYNQTIADRLTFGGNDA
jgi:hypothetical protein